jgi:uncharacterized membrane protein HdeD (DUF308 family)
MATSAGGPVQELRLCWWVFAVRGGLALIFSLVLFLASIFLGVFFFDPVAMVYISLLLGSFVLGNGLLLGVAARFAWEHRLHVWWIILGEACFALLLGIFIGISLMLTAKSLALLAGLHALGNGIFQLSMGSKLRRDGLHLLLLSFAGVLSLALGVYFLAHLHQGARITTQALSGFELFSGLLWLGISLRARTA